MSEGTGDGGWHGPGGLGAAGSGRPTAHDIAMRMLMFSKARLKAFAMHDVPINDAAWELLLGLFVAQERGQRLSLHKLCADVPLPAAVSLRWLRALQAAGMIQYDDRSEGMAAQARLTPVAEGVLRGLIES